MLEMDRCMMNLYITEYNSFTYSFIRLLKVQMFNIKKKFGRLNTFIPSF